jgi:acetylornithine deacetylase
MFDRARHGEALERLLSLDTVTPMEGGGAWEIEAAYDILAEMAGEIGPVESLRLTGSIAGTADGLVPRTVLARIEEGSEAFLTPQRNMVLRLGCPPPAPQLLFNAHLDTVAPFLPTRFADGVYHGRGACDAKGPAVAMLAGVEAAVWRNPGLLDEIGIVMQFVVGEEGGAMGVYGTRDLFARGYRGDLNLFLEPTGGTYIDFSSASMTAEIQVDGLGCTDDSPHRGDNATLILAAVAAHLSRHVAPAAAALGAKFCLAGLHSGEAHNRVYGDGRLLINIAYLDNEAGDAIEGEMEKGVANALADIKRDFRDHPFFSQTAARAREITKLSWLKRRLPTLRNRNLEFEACLEAAGFRRLPEAEAEKSFTCDAIWGGGEGKYGAIIGPGDLTANGAHTAHEFISLADLEAFSGQVATLLEQFRAAATRIDR